MYSETGMENPVCPVRGPSEGLPTIIKNRSLTVFIKPDSTVAQVSTAKCLHARQQRGRIRTRSVCGTAGQCAAAIARGDRPQPRRMHGRAAATGTASRSLPDGPGASCRHIPCHSNLAGQKSWCNAGRALPLVAAPVSHC